MVGSRELTTIQRAARLAGCAGGYPLKAHTGWRKAELRAEAHGEYASFVEAVERKHVARQATH